jgi:hypothetical protein
MKKRMQITISEDLKGRMDMSKDFYGGYSGLIETAVAEFLSRPVEPYPEDIRDSKRARKNNEWIELETLKRKIRRS